ncbi:MAG: hypothetical protein GWM98_25775 [Nitrospinaceae bacterium]|nr:hypothetical protein [Nitrospinaceae bacterium]NIR57263.1 hypothetical protein [Nitrospinaceae bacterium]NIS87711.1 hypothetical protein [Nitrospinaceae bacterium]NIT84577.1 hypothetical protein [Nitrospinaceae bacterium]NIU46763.1 hypothetical protein [Nitrospinaceae bacterium]
MTGTLGDSAAGLRILQSPGKRWQGPASIRNILIRRHRTPEPRVKTAWALARSRIRVTSMIDISDGLTQDLGHILKAAKAGAELWENAIPISKPLIKHSLKNKLPALEMALGGGEDYELLFTLPPEDVKKLNIGSITKAEQPVTQIGVITDGKGIRLKDQEGRTHSLQKPLGFNHFKNKS